MLAISGRTAHEIAFIPLLSILPLRLRLGLFSWRKKITAPILEILDETNGKKYLTESFDIAQYIDSVRVPPRPTLFPSEHAAAIREYNVHAATLTSYMRERLTSLLSQDLDTAERMFVPWALRGWFFTRVLVRLGVWVFTRKYSAESQAAGREAARRALEAVRDGLVRFEGTKLRYLCGTGFTFADIAVTEAIFFDGERHGRFAYLYRDQEFCEAFPDVVAWGRAVRDTHYAEVFRKGG